MFEEHSCLLKAKGKYCPTTIKVVHFQVVYPFKNCCLKNFHLGMRQVNEVDIQNNHCLT